VKIFVIGGVTVSETDADYARQSDLLRRSMQHLGADIVHRGHDLVVCSHFDEQWTWTPCAGQLWRLRQAAVLRPQPDARSVGPPEPAALGLLMGDLQPLAAPDTLDPLVVIVQPVWRSSSAILR